MGTRKPYTVRQRKGRVGWQADVFVNGVRHRVQCATYDEADREAAQLRGQAAPVPKRSRSGGLSFGEVCTDYMAAKGPEVVGVTYTYYQEHLVPATAAFGSVKIAALSKVIVADYIARRTREKSPTCAAKDLTVIKQVLNWAIQHEILDASPVLAIKKPKTVPLERATIYSREEIARMVAGCRGRYGDEWKAEGILLLAGHAGLRRREIVHLHHDWIDLAAGTVTVPTDSTFVAKSKRCRLVPLTPELEAWARRWPDGRALLLDGGGDVIQVRHVMRRAAAAIGAKPAPLSKHSARRLKRKPEERIACVRPHDLRRSFASHLAAIGVPAREIQQLLGHQDIATTDRYLFTTAGYLDRVRVAMASGRYGLAPSDWHQPDPGTPVNLEKPH